MRNEENLDSETDTQATSSYDPIQYVFLHVLILEQMANENVGFVF